MFGTGTLVINSGSPQNAGSARDRSGMIEPIGNDRTERAEPIWSRAGMIDSVAPPGLYAQEVVPLMAL